MEIMTQNLSTVFDASPEKGTGKQPRNRAGEKNPVEEKMLAKAVYECQRGWYHRGQNTILLLCVFPPDSPGEGLGKGFFHEEIDAGK